MAMRRQPQRRSPPRRTSRRSPTASRASSRSQFAGAAEIAEQYAQYASAITAGAKESFLDGADWAYTAGILAIVLGAAVVFFRFPKKQREERLLAEYHAEDTGKRVDSV